MGKDEPGRKHCLNQFDSMMAIVAVVVVVVHSVFLLGFFTIGRTFQSGRTSNYWQELI